MDQLRQVVIIRFVLAMRSVMKVFLCGTSSNQAILCSCAGSVTSGVTQPLHQVCHGHAVWPVVLSKGN
jgi:hypothetical protein